MSVLVNVYLFNWVCSPRHRVSQPYRSGFPWQHTAMAGDPTVATGGELNPTLCMSHYSLLATFRFRVLNPIAHWDRTWTNTNKLSARPRAHFRVMWQYGSSCPAKTRLCVVFRKHLRKHFSSSLLWTRSHLSTGFFIESLVFQKQHFWYVHIWTSIRWCALVVVFKGLVHYQVIVGYRPYLVVVLLVYLVIIVVIILPHKNRFLFWKLSELKTCTIDNDKYNKSKLLEWLALVLVLSLVVK